LTRIVDDDDDGNDYDELCGILPVFGLV